MPHVLAAALLWAAAGRAAVSTEAAAGYVVKVESAAVFLDFGRESGAAPGQPFSIYSEGEELVHPKTGQSLGREQSKVATGQIREVFELYSIGALDADSRSVAKGMPARLAALSAPSPLHPAAPQPAQTPQSQGRAPRWKSPTLGFQIAALAVADFKGDGSLQAALAQTKKAALYSYPFSEDKPLAEYSHPGANVRSVSAEAADLDGDGRAELFLSLYNRNFERFETVVLGFEGAALKRLAELPGVVRALQDASGRKILAVQQLIEDSTYPFAKIYKLAFKEGKYGAGEPVLHPARVDWVFAFTEAELDGAPAVLSLTSTERLRVQFGKGPAWRSGQAYGQTPVRVSWQKKLLSFHPPMPVAYDERRKARVYLAHNISKLGMLSEPFGFFERGEIHRKSWNGVALEDDWKAEMGGYCGGLALVETPNKSPELAVAVVSSAGKSSLWIYDP